MKLATQLIHQFDPIQEKEAGLVAPIHLSTAFAMTTPSTETGHQYGRVSNPTRNLLETNLKTLHKAKFASIFSSGSSAISAVVWLLNPGDRVLVHHQVYEGSLRILESFKKFQIDFELADLTRSLPQGNFAMIWLETPTNPELTILDIKKIAQEKSSQTLLVVDNTLVGPIIQQPLIFGADIVIESMTKVIGGHDDLIAGLAATNHHHLAEKIKEWQITHGAIPSAFDCFLLQRSLKTLPIRTKQKAASAKKIAKFLSQQPIITHVSFPGFDKQQVKIVRRQMTHSGSMISVTFQPNFNVVTFLEKLKLITIAHSLGGVETLIQHPFSMMSHHPRSNVDPQLVRISIGLEDTSDLITDLKQALASQQL